MLVLNPFIYGKPVPPNRLIGRRNEVRTLFGRIYNGESSAVVGEPHIGKSSVLKYISDEEIRREWLGNVATQYVFVEIDCHLLGSDFMPSDFWRQVTDEIAAVVNDDIVAQQRALVIQNNFGSFTLENYFKVLGRRHWRAALLIDEFDALLNHPNFNKAEFLGALRSLAIRTDGLCVVTASRVSVAAMNRKSQEINPHGSPFFNNMTEVRLMPLSTAEAQELVESTLKSIQFTPDDYRFLFAMAGRHPYLLQMAAAALYDTIIDARPAETRYADATRIFSQHAAAHFEDFWQSLAVAEQRSVLVLAVAQYLNHFGHQPMDMRQFGKLDWFELDLRRLRGMGVVESSAESFAWAVPWMGENWFLAVSAFVPWLIENIVSDVSGATSFHAWLRDGEEQGWLSQEEAANLRELGSRVGGNAMDRATEFTGTVMSQKIKSTDLNL